MLKLLIAVVVAIGIGVALAVSLTRSNSPSRPSLPPILGITGQAVTGVPDPQLDHEARVFFRSMLERFYRGRDLPILNASPAITRRLKGVAPGGSPTSMPIIKAIRYRALPHGARQVTAAVHDQQDTDNTTQPLSADFRKVNGRWLATGLPILDTD